MEYPKPKHDLSDPITRTKAPAHERLIWTCEDAVKAFGRDPRGGGFSFVAQPELIEHVVRELTDDQRELQRMVIVGTHESDVVAWWIPGGSGIKIPLRCSRRAKEPEGVGPDGKRRPMPRIWVVPDGLMVPSTRNDRHAAAEIRMRLWKNRLSVN